MSATAAQPTAHAPIHVTARQLAHQLAARQVSVIDVREPVEYAAGHIPGSLNVPLSRLSKVPLPGGPPAWQEAFPVRRLEDAPPALMRQVQILAPGWIWLSGFVGAGLTVAGISGFCGMARLLAAMPWNLPESGGRRHDRQTLG